MNYQTRYFKFITSLSWLDSYWFIAIFYSLFGQSELIQSVEFFFGMNSIYLGYIKKIWGQNISKKVGWR